MASNPVHAIDLSRAARGAFADLNTDHAATLGSIPAARRLAMVCELADFARESYAVQARMARPDASLNDIRAEIVRRMRLRDRT